MKDSRPRNGLAILLIAGIALWLPMRDAGARADNGKKPVRAKPAKEEKNEAPDGQGVTLTPEVFLIRDPVVLAELDLNEPQKAALAELAPAANEEAWKFRDVTPDAGAASEAIQKLNDLMDARLAKLLSPPQVERLEQIVLQIQGPAAIHRPAVAEKLGLSASQRGRIAAIGAEHRQALRDIREQARAGKNPAALSRQLEQLQSGLQSDLLAMLTPAQRGRWNALLGKRLDLARLQPLLAQAPELREVDAWINSEPLTLAGLRGQVVALHFWTFG
ncbi:MAG: hypothetical protein ACM3U2_03905 [Deltaproteobacteria bacterium]